VCAHDRKLLDEPDRAARDVAAHHQRRGFELPGLLKRNRGIRRPDDVPAVVAEDAGERRE
jgi:hypothetical protein